METLELILNYPGEEELLMEVGGVAKEQGIS